MKREFLLEIGTEEIPAGFTNPAMPALSDLFTSALKNAGIGYGPVETYATPRRLILVCRDVETEQAVREVVKTGPPKQAAYDGKGNPTKAAIGFAKSQGVDVESLILVETKRGEQVAVKKKEGGGLTLDLLRQVLPGILGKIPFPKTMRWMDLDTRYARPVHWITALLGDEIVPFEFASISSGNKSRGHRFTHPDEFEVGSFADLVESLESRNVVVDQDARREAITRGIDELAASAGLTVFPDPDLQEEVTYLVERPYPLMGAFSKDFLELPAAILITCMKKHQRYFSLKDEDAAITNRFIAVNNTPVKDPDVSIKGHQRVLKARLEDARFYYLEDRKAPLMDRLEALKGVVFHSRLGTSYEKVQRFTHLAGVLARQIAPEKMADVERAALLAKCDLETGVVYEFPELQGKIGALYATLDGESEEIAQSIREHYLPAYAGDDLPKEIVGSIVSLADRIDTISGCFSVGLIPTGAADPYALRRHSLGTMQILIGLGSPLDLRSLVMEAVGLVGEKRRGEPAEIVDSVMDFFRTRFVNFHTSQDFPLDVVEAAVRARFNDVVDARRRVEALSHWKTRDDFEAIMIGFKRVVNILKDTEPAEMSEDLLDVEEEKALYEALKDVKRRADPLIEQGEYAGALEIIAELKAPIDSFFDEVMVMTDDESVKRNRLGLLRNVAVLFSNIADFSFIGSTAG